MHGAARAARASSRPPSGRSRSLPRSPPPPPRRAASICVLGQHHHRRSGRRRVERQPRLPVEKARKMSPLPLFADAADPREAQRSPVAPAAGTGCGSSGASVASTTMIEPPPRGDVAMRRHDVQADLAARPARRRRAEVARCRSSPAPARRPSRPPRRPAGTTRDAVPMPPLNSWQIMPVPPPTSPSATGAARRAVERREGVRGRDVKASMSLSQPSKVSADDRQEQGCGDALARIGVGDDRVAHHAHRVGVGDADRASSAGPTLQPGQCRSSRRCR